LTQDSADVTSIAAGYDVMTELLRAGVVALLLLVGLGPAAAQDSRSGALPTVATPVISKDGMVVAQESRAARIGAQVLSRGGNAVDAAVATSFALAVTYPRAGNLGGGGFMVIHLAGKDGAAAQDIAIDYRETAPAATTKDIFLGTDGRPDPQKSRDSALGIGVPGTVAGLALALEKYGSGKFRLAELLAPSIALAQDGIDVTDDTADSLPDAQRRLAAWPSSAKIFLKENGQPLGEGDRLVQTDLAATLAGIATGGPRAFYEGPIAAKLIAAIRSAGGIMTTEDLRNYQPEIAAPVRGTYRGYDIVSMPLPSSGGIVLMEMLNILEGYDFAAMSAADRVHLTIEAMKRGYADRAHELGDPRFIDVPVQRLISKDYAAALRGKIDPARATPSSELAKTAPPRREGSNTTHVSVTDRDGNAVSNTTTLNFNYGVGFVADGTGVLLNNELDDFTSPVASNGFELIGFEANFPGPNKKPLSSMSPTIVLKDGKPVLVTGSPGGPRIITTVLQVLIDTIDLKRDVAAAVNAPRLHHQWMPDEVRIEKNYPADIVESLKARGHAINAPLGYTSANSIAAVAGGWQGAADPRTRGAAAIAP
jgi:gamma-glutamyltranspeptidase / glutathione hydrolase